MFRFAKVLIVVSLVAVATAFVERPAAQGASADSQGLKQRVDALAARVAALEAAVPGGGGNLATELVGTWTGSRFITPWSWSGLIQEESGFSFTFRNDGTYSASTWPTTNGHYAVAGHSVVAGDGLMIDVQVSGDTLTFATDNRFQTNLYVLGTGALYVLKRQ